VTASLANNIFGRKRLHGSYRYSRQRFSTTARPPRQAIVGIGGQSFVGEEELADCREPGTAVLRQRAGLRPRPILRGVPRDDRHTSAARSRASTAPPSLASTSVDNYQRSCSSWTTRPAVKTVLEAGFDTCLGTSVPCSVKEFAKGTAGRT